MEEMGVAYTKSSKDCILFTGEIGSVRVCKNIGLNVIECIGGMIVPKGMCGGKKRGGS